MKTKAMLIGGILSLLIFSFSWTALLGATSEEVIEIIGQSEVNWTQSVIRVFGRASSISSATNKGDEISEAERAAKVVALRSLSEAVQGIRIDSKTTVIHTTTQDPVVKAKLEGFILDAEVVNRKFFPNGVVEIVLQMPITGALVNTLLPEAVEKSMSNTGSLLYTGLIIDAEGLRVCPALSPKIIDEDGKEVYGLTHISRGFAIKEGMVGYSKNLEGARKNERVGNNPIVIKGIRTAGQGRCNVVIKNSDASLLKDPSKNLSFLYQCRVMFVID